MDQLPPIPPMPEGDDPTTWNRTLYNLIVNLYQEVNTLRRDFTTMTVVQQELTELKKQTALLDKQVESQANQLKIAKWIGGIVGALALGTIWKLIAGG